MSRLQNTRLRRSAVLVAVVVAALTTATACLPPGAPDPTGHAPFGSLDVAVQSGAGLRVAGWVIDPDTSAPIPVQVSVQGQDLRTITADRERPDVAAAYPGRGSAHGFDLTVPDLGPGTRSVCVWANDVGVGGDSRLLGCRTLVISVDPFGSFDTLTADFDGGVRAGGWVADPETTGPSDVGIVMDAAMVVVQRTDVERPDVQAAYGLGSRRGFDIRFPASPGRHTVCVIAGNVGWGTSRFIGCSDVVVPVPQDRRPNLWLSSVVPVDGGARIRGTVTDPDTTGPVTVNVRIDGGAIRSIPVSGGVLDTTITGLAAGRHQLCVSAVDVPGLPAHLTGDRVLPCSSVVSAVGGAPAIGTVGAPPSTVAVGPAGGAPLERIDRDGGVSAQLRDGSMLWLFGDSSEVDAAGAMRYFVNNTAAWAPPGAPALTRDAAVGGRPVQFADPGAAFTCPPNRPTKALWPLSAVVTPSGSKDLVTAFFGEVCLGEGFLNVEDHGVSVVQWTYDPASPPDGTPIRGSLVTQNLFPAGLTYGTAAVAVADRGAGAGDAGWFVYGYRCAGPTGAGPFWPSQYGPCTVARVPVASAGDRSAWRFWNGASWVLDVGAATPILAGTGADPEVPVAAFTVTRDAALGAYVMAYSPWPGFTDRVYVRVSSSPTGPWSAPVTINLPGCSDTVGATGYWCYAGTAQPAFSSTVGGSTSIGLGWYDQLVSANPLRGQYRAASVPFAVRF